MSETDAYAALRNPIVRRFAGGRFGAVLGLQMISVAVGWHLYERTGSAWALGLVGAIELAPVFLLLPITGTVADRFPRRNVGIVAYSALALSALGLTYISWTQAPVELVYGLISSPLHHALTMPQAFLAYIAFCGLMLACSITKERVVAITRAPAATASLTAAE